MWWLAAIEAAKTVLSYYNSMEEAERQKKDSDEQLRRYGLERDQELGRATALAGASGIDVNNSKSSLSIYLEAMKRESLLQADWAQNASLRERRAIRQSAEWRAGTDFISGLFKYGQASNWFGLLGDEQSADATGGGLGTGGAGSRPWWLDGRRGDGRRGELDE